MKTEKQLHNYTKTQAKRFDVGFFKLECVGRRGFPDVMLAFNRRIIFVELKSPSGAGVLSPLQKRMISHLHSLGITVYVADSTELIDQIIAELIN